MKGRGSQPKTHTNSPAPIARGGLFAAFGKKGYTIVEVMIFLGVTTAIFVMIAGTFSRRQAGTEFSIAAREMESRLQDMVNDVSTGFYSNPGNFTCRVVAGTPTITNGTNQQGTNQDCIFIGRVAQFDLADPDNKQYNIYSVVGARQASGQDVVDFDQARPVALASPRSSVDLTEDAQAPPGLTITSVYAEINGTPHRVRGLGLFTSFDPGGSGDTSALAVNVLPIGLAPTTDSKDSVVNSISAINNSYFTNWANPNGGVYICMDGDLTDQHALLQLGGNDRQLATDLIIGEGSCDAAGYSA